MVARLRGAETGRVPRSPFFSLGRVTGRTAWQLEVQVGAGLGGRAVMRTGARAGVDDERTFERDLMLSPASPVLAGSAEVERADAKTAVAWSGLGDGGRRRVPRSRVARQAMS